MNEVVRSLLHGGHWTSRERRVGRWIRNVLLVGIGVAALAWNAHMQRIGARDAIWREWTGEQCLTGDQAMCMSYADFSHKSGMPSARFWAEHPHLKAQANCIERWGWLTLSIGRTDYSALAARCSRASSP